jgi:two-component system, NtrC family, sensor histidine kinase HydH
VQASGAGSSVVVSVSEVARRSRASAARVLLAVSDSGPGIEPASRAKIFDAFFTTRSQGAGIGLAVVRRIIDEHASVGVTIDVRNNADSPGPGTASRARGAVFEVGLACASTPGRRTATRPPAAASDPDATPLANARLPFE